MLSIKANHTVTDINGIYTRRHRETAPTYVCGVLQVSETKNNSPSCGKRYFLVYIFIYV